MFWLTARKCDDDNKTQQLSHSFLFFPPRPIWDGLNLDFSAQANIRLKGPPPNESPTPLSLRPLSSRVVISASQRDLLHLPPLLDRVVINCQLDEERERESCSVHCTLVYLPPPITMGSLGVRHPKACKGGDQMGFRAGPFNSLEKIIIITLSERKWDTDFTPPPLWTQQQQQRHFGTTTIRAAAVHSFRSAIDDDVIDRNVPIIKSMGTIQQTISLGVVLPNADREGQKVSKTTLMRESKWMNFNSAVNVVKYWRNAQRA